MILKTILKKEYKGDGILIDVNDEITYNENHLNNAINIPYNKLIHNFETLLDKKNKYYVYCTGGIKSKKIVSLLELYNYDITQLK